MSTPLISTDQPAAPAAARCKLNDAQVVALQAAAAGTLIRYEQRYPFAFYIAGDTNVKVKPATVEVLFKSCLVEIGEPVGVRRPILATVTGRSEAAARRGPDGQRVPALVDLSKPQQRALQALDTLRASGGVTMATLRANGVRRDVMDRLCAAKLVFVAGDHGDPDRVRFDILSAGARVLATA